MATKKIDYKKLAEDAAKYKKESDLAAQLLIEKAVKKFFKEELEDDNDELENDEDVSDEELEQELADELSVSDEEDNEKEVDVENDEETKDDEDELNIEEDEELDLDIEDDEEDEEEVDIEEDEELDLDSEDDEELDLDIEDDEDELNIEDDEELDLDIEGDEELDLDIEDDEELDLDIEDDEEDEEEVDIEKAFSTLENKKYLKRAALSLEKANLQNAKTKALSSLFTNYRMSESVYKKILKQLDKAKKIEDVGFIYSLVKENLQPKTKFNKRKNQSASRFVNNRFSKPTEKTGVIENRFTELAGIDD